MDTLIDGYYHIETTLGNITISVENGQIKASSKKLQKLYKFNELSIITTVYGHFLVIYLGNPLHASPQFKLLKN